MFEPTRAFKALFEHKNSALFAKTTTKGSLRMLQIIFDVFDFLDNTEHTGYQFCQFRWILILFAYFINLFSVLLSNYVIPFV